MFPVVVHKTIAGWMVTTIRYTSHYMIIISEHDNYGIKNIQVAGDFLV